MTTALVPFTEMTRMAESVAKSGLFGIKTTDQAMALMLLCQAEGLHPAIAVRDYHIVEGKPALKADAMLARFQAGGGIIEWVDYSDTKVSAKFSHPSSPKPVLIEWSIEMAHKVKVWNGKKNAFEPITAKFNWQSYPRQMMKARVISEGVRATNPGVAVGVYTPEEVQDFAPEKDITPPDGAATVAPQLPGPITPTTGALASQPAARQEVIIATAEQIKEAFAEDRLDDAYSLYSASGFDAEEKIALWSLLDSKIRSALKRMNEAERSTTAGTISPAQKKRLEALIKERGLDRENVKTYCKAQYGKEHFGDLTGADYADLEVALDGMSNTEKAA